MADTTTNYGLTKPLQSESYNVDVQNGNMDIIDENLKLLATQSSDKVNKTSVINNVSVTEEGFVADARQIKILNDKIQGKQYKSGNTTLGYYSNTLLTGTVTLTGITSGIAILTLRISDNTPIESTNIIAGVVANGVLIINAYGTGYINGHVLSVDYLVIEERNVI